MTNEVKPEAPGLNINDLAFLVQIIDTCSKRGAFEGSEMAAVGGVRGRIADFVKANTPAEEAEAEQAPTATEE